MKRFLAPALVLASFSTLGFVGCSEESKVTDKQTIQTPEGTKTQTTEVKTEATGDMKEGAAPKPADAPH